MNLIKLLFLEHVSNKYYPPSRQANRVYGSSPVYLGEDTFRYPFLSIYLGLSLILHSLNWHLLTHDGDGKRWFDEIHILKNNTLE